MPINKAVPLQKRTHDEAMAIINATAYVKSLSYEEAIAVYLRARHILKDTYDYLASPMPVDWEPTPVPPPMPGGVPGVAPIAPAGQPATATSSAPTPPSFLMGNMA